MKLPMIAGLAIFAIPFSIAATPLQHLTITATTADVSIAPQEPGRQFIDLPDLEYQFLIEPRCAEGWEALTVTLSIADSRGVVDSAAIDEHGLAAADLAIPAAQLAPLPLSGFCEIDANNAAASLSESSDPAHRVGAALSMHAALICGNGETERVTYQTRPLAIRLRCDTATTKADD